MPDARLEIAVTGAEGLIGGVLRAHLCERYRIRALTRGPAPFASAVVDLADLEGLTAAVQGADAVVHLAAASRVESAWPEVLDANLIGAYHLFEAARLAGVPRVVFASSNHVVGYHELEAAPGIYRRRGEALLDEATPPRPDSLYGVSKGFGELLGRYYSDRYAMQVVCLRLGSVLPGDDPEGPAPPGLPPAQAAAWPERIRATWLSHRDCAQLVARAVEADVRFALVYGTSGNATRLWSLEAASRLLGYVPLDHAPDGAEGSGG